MSRNPIARHIWKQNKPKVIPDKRNKKRKPGIYHCAGCGEFWDGVEGEKICACGNQMTVDDQ